MDQILYLKKPSPDFYMRSYSEKQIRKLHREFSALKKYVEKLSFFNSAFDIIPFPFPDFDPKLRYLFEKEKTDQLISIFRNERNNPDLTRKHFDFNESFVFNIKPANSNSPVYSNYILSLFLSKTPDFSVLKKEIERNEGLRLQLLEEGNNLVNNIETKLNYSYEKSLGVQCMSVFYTGFYDRFTEHIHSPDKKRKFIELFLYAQGVIYANYMFVLKKINPQNGDLQVNGCIEEVVKAS